MMTLLTTKAAAFCSKKSSLFLSPLIWRTLDTATKTETLRVLEQFMVKDNFTSDTLEKDR